jgi:hypothetical protein
MGHKSGGLRHRTQTSAVGSESVSSADRPGELTPINPSDIYAPEEEKSVKTRKLWVLAVGHFWREHGARVYCNSSRGDTSVVSCLALCREWRKRRAQTCGLNDCVGGICPQDGPRGVGWATRTVKVWSSERRLLFCLRPLRVRTVSATHPSLLDHNHPIRPMHFL